MRHPEYSSMDPETGNVNYRGALSLEKGDHTHMPGRTGAYRPGDERGHVNASSLGGSNLKANIVPQNADLNHGAYLSVEKGERIALLNGATIESEKTAIVNNHPGDRPSAFIINDSVRYPDGHTESIHHSFANESNADQSAWNDMSASLPGTFDADNPGDGLRSSMSAESYASLMDEIDASLPNLEADYAPAGVPGLTDTSSVSADIGADSNVNSSDCNADLSGGTSVADAGGGDGGASADAY